MDIAEANGRQIDGGANGADNTWFNPAGLHQVHQAAGDDILAVVYDLELGSVGGGIKFWVDCPWVECHHDF